MKFQPDPAGEAEVPERSQKRQDWVAMILVCLVNLSLSSLGDESVSSRWFSLYIHIYIFIYTHVLEFGMGIFLFWEWVWFFLIQKNQDDQKHRVLEESPLKAVASRAYPIWVKKKSPTLNLIPKNDPKNASILIVQNFKSQKLDSFWFPNTVIRVEITFVFHGFFMSVVMNFKHILASTENKQKKSPPSVGMIFAMQFANRNGGDKRNIYILYIHSTDIYIYT